ncbi:hypothetical protein ACJIZ3_017897 [Penstemon smallii]|uniref:PAR1 protein n=1 Tax=Penstemon smallii TaxID=265156 RepID=A0ABD3SXB1_9LAMI
MMKMVLFFTFFLFLGGSLGELVCEELPVGMCSFSISSSGNRCLLETYESDEGMMKLKCETSKVAAMNLHEYIESDECVSACGVDRNSVGISSDTLLESQFTLKLCSPQCYQSCPNIVELYYNLALAEGVFLPELCKDQRRSQRRSVIQLQSSSAASGPISAASGPIAASALAPVGSSESSFLVDGAPAPL